MRIVRVTATLAAATVRVMSEGWRPKPLQRDATLSVKAVALKELTSPPSVKKL
jgi:hypothetical protein